MITDHTDLVVHTLQDLGLKVNEEKSQLQPTQRIQYLGYEIDTTGRFPVIRAQKDRISRIKKQIRSVLKSGSATARVIAKTAGLCVSVAWAVSPGKLFLRSLYALLATKKSWEQKLVLNVDCENELRWWLNAAEEWNYYEVKPQTVDVQIVTDASHIAWGGKLGNLEAKGDWDCYNSCQSSNYRELLAIFMTVHTFKDRLKDKHVQVLTDNVSAMAYVNHKGGPCPKLSKLSVALWALAAEINSTLTCRHISGCNNTEADRLSRTPDKFNWMLNPGLFSVIDVLWGPHQVDRFATLQNTQLHRFNSRFWEPMTEGVDAFAQSWSGENNYINPPWVLLPRVVEKIIQDKAWATIIAPEWPSQPWFSRMMTILVDEPAYLPKRKGTFLFKGLRPEPTRNWGWKIAAWRVCGAMA
jgi:hypothetical protein